MGITLGIMAVGLWLPRGLLARPAAYYGWLLTILLGYCLLTTLMMREYIRR